MLLEPVLLLSKEVMELLVHYDNRIPFERYVYKSVKTKKEQENKKVLIVDKGKLLTGQEEVNIPIVAYVCCYSAFTFLKEY